uniref:Calmodulin n=1 Tax=Aplanochytrium stocchinoi TaxID=215587 RepID=A0A7S3V2L9_9STRA|mmetsp:Transcript_1098/g.1445  ORF Transcript_1098/g.1445 Transcript_1098/m.1445 type:complete len:564 (+) Transcript_1098:150-1841(+)|eukprot:CAMPEP_0204870022 /NCGR_PEP_ID=MMETSP1348-20121228/31294_1 /ASSEMBLY_ACC=CAM_ASM_000700 /TAXON_ID=215587 /ORGANISM="Aplanochytrium stocchinoi, Strain GSBS06" /LENGTH=563 /DNA_ID=CAMNT_0052023621 /DNA_START=118 /DNA_END=1809 /DNA_ORIENTATION=-
MEFTTNNHDTEPMETDSGNRTTAPGAPITVPPPGVPFDYGRNFDCKAAIRDLYDIGKELGRGAFSVVYQATCKETGEQVAVKVVSYSTFRPGDLERQKKILENEVRIMQKISVEIPDNPNLIRLKRVVREDTRMGIVMELLKGKELFERIVKRKKYTEHDAAMLMVRIMKAIQALHKVNILHRDLKPENLVFENEGDDAEVKISDFGLGSVMGWPDVHNSVVGTPNYVAPEVVSVRPRGPFYGPPCDVWSMGVILYILLVGYPPFYHDVPRELFKLIRRGRYEFHERKWAGISDAAKDLVTRMLVVDRTRRVTITEFLQHPWILSQAPDTNLSDTLTNLKKLNAKRRFKAAAMAVVWGVQLGLRRKLLSLVDNSVANVFNLQELSKIRDTFYRYASADATIAIPAFRATMYELGFQDLPIERVFNLFDQNGDGRIDYKEFLTNLATLRESGEPALKFCFDVYDTDGSGYISRHNVANVLSSVIRDNVTDPNQVSMQLESIFQAFDEDGDGKISYEEFTTGIFTKGPILVEHFLGPMDKLSELADNTQNVPGFIMDVGEDSDIE